MRTAGLFALLVAFTFTCSAGAFAKTKDEGSFDLAQPATVGSTQLQPGHYKAEWTDTNGTINVAIMQHGQTIATTKATLKELDNRSPYDAVTLRAGSNNRNRIEEIDFSNRKDALILSGARTS